MPQLPLEGVRIIEACEVWAGPYAGTLLGDLGAEVIKIEPIQRATHNRGPVRPSPASPWGTGYPDAEPGQHPWNRAADFNRLNRNKMSFTLDLSRPRGVEIYKQLVAITEVVIENYASETMRKLGVDYPVLKEVNSNLIMVSMPGFGVEGPYKGYVGLGYVFDSVAGHAGLRGYPDDEIKGSTGILHADGVAALNCVLAVLMALRYKRRTGRGQFIDIAQTEAFMPHLGWAVMDYTMNKRVQSSIGNRDTSMAPHGVYRCKGDDSWVALAIGSDDEWKRFCQAIGNPSWTQDEKFKTALSRWKHQDELDKLIELWTIEHDHYEVMQRLQNAGVAAGALLDDTEVYSDPHIFQSGFFEVAPHSEAGIHPYPAISYKLTKTPLSVRRPPALLGEDNEFVLRGLLGLSEQEIIRLGQERIIGTVPIEALEEG